MVVEAQVEAAIGTPLVLLVMLVSIRLHQQQQYLHSSPLQPHLHSLLHLHSLFHPPSHSCSPADSSLRQCCRKCVVSSSNVLASGQEGRRPQAPQQQQLVAARRSYPHGAHTAAAARRALSGPYAPQETQYLRRPGPSRAWLFVFLFLSLLVLELFRLPLVKQECERQLAQYFPKGSLTTGRTQDSTRLFLSALRVLARAGKRTGRHGKSKRFPLWLLGCFWLWPIDTKEPVEATVRH